MPKAGAYCGFQVAYVGVGLRQSGAVCGSHVQVGVNNSSQPEKGGMDFAWAGVSLEKPAFDFFGIGNGRVRFIYSLRLRFDGAGLMMEVFERRVLGFFGGKVFEPGWPA